jgi:hypothetical protein
MDHGVERIKQLSRQARERAADGKAEHDLELRNANRTALAGLEVAIPARLHQLAAAADGDLAVEDTTFRSSTSTAMQIEWRPGSRDSHAVELWLLRETGSVEWRWAMGHREPQIVHRVPASRFDLARLDEIVAALAEPEHWLGGHHPDV